MKAVVQRVREARVEVGGEVVGRIGPGLLVLVCAMRGDGEREAERLLQRLLKLRVFSDEQGKMNRSVQDVGGGLLIVSQFTLAAEFTGGNRPSFSSAAPPEEGRRLYEQLLTLARAAHPDVASGQFAADMQVHLVNDGPVTIPIEIMPLVNEH
jgi:D-tyrosyl-tRNA(Tyr) deacylase